MIQGQVAESVPGFSFCGPMQISGFQTSLAVRPLCLLDGLPPAMTDKTESSGEKPAEETATEQQPEAPPPAKSPRKTSSRKKTTDQPATSPAETGMEAEQPGTEETGAESGGDKISADPSGDDGSAGGAETSSDARETETSDASDKAAVTAPDEEYRVLARKYRPTDFTGLVGQDALVKTLSNAFRTGRIAHAFLLTGVRGVGKTTTARIIARALNCIGEDGQGGPTITPCGVCSNCQAIAGDRHVDVIEMDAASRTGVNDVREIIDGVRYLPVQGRYKVYIIDEVHMLSTAAFNALLKTLEEPPPHVKFLFATTEIRKVPVTVLSRCQKFDLRRVEVETLSAHFARICAAEKTEATSDGLAMIARAADGSVRDGLSLLDQAITLGGGLIDEAMVRDMLGLADRERVLSLLDDVFAGRIPQALDGFGVLTSAGADPLVVIQDLLDLIHLLTRLKVVPKNADDLSLPELERTRGREMADALSIPVLTRAWQMCLKGISEIQQALRPREAAEMLLIRMACASDLPDPARLVRSLRKLESAGGPAAGGPGGAGGGGGNAPRAMAGRNSGALFGAGSSTPPNAPPAMAPRLGPGPAAWPEGGYNTGGGQQGQPWPSVASASPAPRDTGLSPNPGSFEAVVELFRQHKEPILAGHLTNNVRLVSFRPGHLEVNPGSFAPPDLPGKVGQLLSEWTGQRWFVSTSTEKGENTLSEQAQKAWVALKDRAAEHDLVRAALELWPDAEITTVRPKDPPASLPEAGPVPVGMGDFGSGEEHVDGLLADDGFEDEDLIDWS